MHFSVIYSFDIPRHISVKRYLPARRLGFQQTEGDEQYELGHLEGVWAKGKHRKLCALLNRKQFEEFLRDTGLYADSTPTMGSIGAPGFGVGWAPAIAFQNGMEAECCMDAWVTPTPDVKMSPNDWRQPRSARGVWERVRRAVISTYKDGV